MTNSYTQTQSPDSKPRPKTQSKTHVGVRIGEFTMGVRESLSAQVTNCSRWTGVPAVLIGANVGFLDWTIPLLLNFNSCSTFVFHFPCRPV